MEQDVWTSREGVGALSDEVKGYDVEGRDGSVGKVDHVSYTGSCVIVSTGRILGKKFVIPASTIERVDHDSKTILVDLTQEEIEGSPEYDDQIGFDEDCERRVGAYYREVPTRRTSVTR
jgi:hypothetical protein